MVEKKNWTIGQIAAKPYPASGSGCPKVKTELDKLDTLLANPIPARLSAIHGLSSFFQG